MKKKKLKLDELRVKSFVTLDKDAISKTIKAGINSDIDVPVDPIKNPLETKIDCGPTPGTWCYYCPIDY